MSLAPSGRGAFAAHGLASLVLSLAAAGCPGPEPANLSGEGGAGSTGTGPTSVGSTSASSGETTGVSSGKTTGVGGAGGAGGAGGEGSTASSGGSAPTGTGGHGGAGAGGCDAALESDPENCGACGRACAEVEAEQLVCAEGRCKPVCREGFSTVTAPEAPEADDGCETPWRRAFVTLEPELLPFRVDDPNVVGVAAADAICQERAAGLGGTWRAWISDGLLPPPRERFTPHAVPYWLLDGTVIATGFDDVIDGALDAPIHVTEAGTSLFDLFPERGSFPVWTATDELGESTEPNCSDWGPENGNDQLGQVGLVADYEAEGLDASAWTRFPEVLSCFDDGVRLYCFEQ